MGRALATAAVAALLAAPPAAREVRGLSAAARVNHDVGTLFVSGTETGPGGGISVRASFGDDDVRWEPELLAIAGGGAIFPVRVALGVSIAPDSEFGLELAAFNRFSLSSTGGDPSTEYVNSTGVELAVRFGR